MAWRNKHTISLAVCALALAAGLTVKPAMAYFTDYVEASGAVPITIADPEAEISEGFGNWTKRITITNNGTEPCFVRVKAIAAEKYTLTFLAEDSTDWTDGGDGYYYYSEPLAASGDADNKDTTKELDIRIDGVSDTDTEEFNVVIIQEATKVLYDANGNAYPADWELASGTDQN
jgi:hypothetical protein